MPQNSRSCRHCSCLVVTAGGDGSGVLGDDDRRPQVGFEEKNVEKGKESAKDPLRHGERGDERGNENLQRLADYQFSSLVVDRGIGIGAEGGGVGRGALTERKAFITAVEAECNWMVEGEQHP